jgi:excisionase family DNA binding protein
MELQDIKVPSASAAAQARTAARALAPLLKGRPRPETVTIRPENGTPKQSVTVPREAFELFLRVLEQMAAGNAVTIFPYHPELTTQQAAELLNVSRPFLIKLLEEGKIEFRKVGTHRRIKMEALLKYRQEESQRRKELIDAHTAEAQNLDQEY